MVKRNAIATKLTKRCTQTQKQAFDVAVGALAQCILLAAAISLLYHTTINPDRGSLKVLVAKDRFVFSISILLMSNSTLASTLMGPVVTSIASLITFIVMTESVCFL